MEANESLPSHYVGPFWSTPARRHPGSCQLYRDRSWRRILRLDCPWGPGRQRSLYGRQILTLRIPENWRILLSSTLSGPGGACLLKENRHTVKHFLPYLIAKNTHY